MTIHTSRSSGLGNKRVDDTRATVVTLDREAARAAISAAAGRFTALLRETDDIGRPAGGHRLDGRRDRGPCVLSC